MLLHELITSAAEAAPDAKAVRYKDGRLSYAALSEGIDTLARGLLAIGLAANERVAVYMEKRLENVTALFGTSRAGGVFVPVNPLLKPEQVVHILRDCNVRILITTGDRYSLLRPQLAQCHDLRSVVILDMRQAPEPENYKTHDWNTLPELAGAQEPHRRVDCDLAAILYTSGSTGRPKGVVLSHHNMVAGAKSVSTYLKNTPDDRILAVLPFSFDYGLSQLTTAFHRRASVVLLNYLLPRDVIKAAGRYGITGLAAVPPLWIQLSQLDWPPEVAESLRYATNSGGAMPKAALQSLRSRLPKTDFYLMYGLTEAFRSTYLPPSEIDKRPDSIGKAIPNAEILVVREDGTPCAPGEPGELVHRGALVARGYWNDPERTAERFRPAPNQETGVPLPEIAVWSGDTVRRDEDGYLYFVGRKDDMIKTSGYRVSPSEVEEVVYATGKVGEAAAVGVAHPVLGQAIVLVVTAPEEGGLDTEWLMGECKRRLPAFMVPAHIERYASLPRNPNGKIDRKKLAAELAGLFQEGHQ